MSAGDITRFVKAQETSYQAALTEIRNGRKTSHWMWWIFPQLVGLGQSHYAQVYGIRGLGEAKKYLEHELLSGRLIEISNALLALPGDDATAVMGKPDDMKLRSSMTLFASVPGADPVFSKVLDKYYQGRKDEKTLQMIEYS